MDFLYTGKWRMLKENNITDQNIDFVKPIAYTAERERKLEESIQKSWSDYIHGVNPKLGISPYPWLGSGDTSGHHLPAADAIPSQVISGCLFGSNRALAQIVETLGKTIHKKFQETIKKAKVHPTMSLFEMAHVRTVKLVLPLKLSFSSNGAKGDLDLYQEILDLLPEGTDSAAADMLIKNVIMPAVWRDLQENGDIGGVRRGSGPVPNQDDDAYYISL